MHYIENHVYTWVTNCFSTHKRVIWMSRVCTEAVCHSSIYIILFLIWHNESINDDKMTIFTYCLRVSVTQLSLCWWRHNWLLMTSQWHDNCDVITWIMISNLLDIDFIHSDIHGQSCKKVSYYRANSLENTQWQWGSDTNVLSSLKVP